MVNLNGVGVNLYIEEGPAKEGEQTRWDKVGIFKLNFLVYERNLNRKSIAALLNLTIPAKMLKDKILSMRVKLL